MPSLHPLCLAAIKEAFGTMSIPLEGSAQIRLSLPVCHYQLLLTRLWRQQTVARPLHSWLRLWGCLFVPFKASWSCIRYDVPNNSLLLSRLHRCLLHDHTGWSNWNRKRQRGVNTNRNGGCASRIGRWSQGVPMEGLPSVALWLLNKKR